LSFFKEKKYSILEKISGKIKKKKKPVKIKFLLAYKYIRDPDRISSADP